MFAVCCRWKIFKALILLLIRKGTILDKKGGNKRFARQRRTLATDRPGADGAATPLHPEKENERIMKRQIFFKAGLPVLAAALLVAVYALAAQNDAVVADALNQAGASGPWWMWPLILLFFCFILGIIAVLAGVGGGVLYVPLVSGFFPFHLDFVRGAGLMVALAGALAAGPGLLKRNLASLRLALPVALIASACAIVGAMIGLALPTNVVQIALGSTILFIAILILKSKNVAVPEVKNPDALGIARELRRPEAVLGLFQAEPGVGDGVFVWLGQQRVISVLRRDDGGFGSGELGCGGAALEVVQRFLSRGYGCLGLEQIGTGGVGKLGQVFLRLGERRLCRGYCLFGRGDGHAGRKIVNAGELISLRNRIACLDEQL